VPGRRVKPRKIVAWKSHGSNIRSTAEPQKLAQAAEAAKWHDGAKWHTSAAWPVLGGFCHGLSTVPPCLGARTMPPPFRVAT